MSTTGMHPYVPGNHDKTKRVPSSEVKAPVQYSAETAAGRSSIEVHRSASGSVRELLPKEINDDRFKDLDRRRKRIKCDSCLEVKCGNNVGVGNHILLMFFILLAHFWARNVKIR